MTLAAGVKLGPYEILSPLGAGGMGEVYRARDTRLDRVVAVKVLPTDLAATAELKARFEREAKAVSALSHPHICALYDVGSEGGVEYLVMEYLEGETLEDRIGKGALPVEQVLKFGIQIADALERAHRQGIVHRDLKPGNVMLTRSGVKLLDFGLAKSVAPLGELRGDAPSSLPTAAGPSRLTERGTIMGTFQYMAPEQLEGKDADARTDIFALGAVLYEMATGKKAFYGTSRASLISSILRDDPRPISSIAPMTPPAFDRVVKTCVAKDPDDRFQTAHDVKLQLEWLAEAGSQAGAPAVVASRRKSRERLAWIVAGVAALAALGLALGFALRARRSSDRVLRASIELPEGLTIQKENASLALSPDGRRLAFVGEGSDGKTQIHLRTLDGLATPALAGTEDASYPFWSPDGRSLGFFADGKLKRIELTGGAVQTICDAPQGRGATWGPDGTIVFTPNVYGTMHRVSASGGTPVPAESEMSPLDVSHRNPHFLPDGKTVLYYASASVAADVNLKSSGSQTAGIYALDLSTKKARLIAPIPSEAYFVPPGYLAFVRQKNVMVQRFDPKSLRASGEPVPIAERVEFNGFRGTAEFTFAGPDLFVYQTETAPGASQLAWFDLDGKKLSTVGEPAEIVGLAVSPDGTRAAATVSGAEGSQIWIVDLASGGRLRITFGTDAASNPVWSPDGREVAYAAHTAEGETMQVGEIGGGAPPRTIYKGVNFAAPESWSPDGKTISFSSQSTATKSFDVGVVPAAGGPVRMLVASSGNESGSAFSPDGRWLMYGSDESGRVEVYVTRYPEGGAKWQLTSAGAVAVWWNGPGEIGYVGAERRAYVLPVKADETGLSIAVPRRVFGETPFPHSDANFCRSLHRFLLTVPAGPSRTTPLTVVTNWAAALPR